MSEASLLFDVGRWMFDVRRSSFKLFDVHLFYHSTFGVGRSALEVQNIVPVIKKMNRFAHDAKRKAQRNPDLWSGFLCALK